MAMRRTVSGQFELATDAATAIDFFTPEGERSWARGWDPTYPAGEPSESPGTVFVTRDGDIETIWMVEKINRRSNAAAYARVTPGHHAGTVRVRIEDQDGDQCIVSVVYDMTSLSPDLLHLAAYSEESFAAMMEEWASLVSAAL